MINSEVIGTHNGGRYAKSLPHGPGGGGSLS